MFCNLSATSTVRHASLSPLPTHISKQEKAHRCAEVEDACFDGEQIFLHGANAQRHKLAIDSVLRWAKDLYDIKKMLRPWDHRIAHVARPGEPYTYLPLAINSHAATGPRIKSNDSSAYQQRRQPEGASVWSETTALAYVSVWSQAFTDAFARGVTQVFEQWCDHDGRLEVIPAAWGSVYRNDVDYVSAFLAPLSASHVQPMSLTPRPEAMQLALMGMLPPHFAAPGRARCGGRTTCLRKYMQESEAYLGARGQRCFRRALVCDYGILPERTAIRPWSLMQAIAAFHGGTPPLHSLTNHHMRACEHEGAASGRGGHGQHCPLRVLYIRRVGRRRLVNLDEHVAACNEWRPARGSEELTLQCEAHSFENGLQAALPLLRRTDVLIGPHGAEMTNALALHAGASVAELLPPIRAQCPCDMYSNLFSAETKVLHYTVTTRNRSFALRTGDPKLNDTYSADFYVPVELTARILARVVTVGGKLSNYHLVDRQHSF